ncbi:hypothetical protein ABID59_000960 [Bradyrhizobium sp. S3.3.6]|uniref:hypothetical protein n=1 Tax=Bradyrhizobium sp. S3.3.6 TaxID=3156429 RepID=UPI003395767A
MMESMRPCHRSRDQTQPDFSQANISSVLVALALPQLVHQLFEMRREPGFGANALLQPFAHGIANRAAGAPVDLFAVIGRRASHRRVPYLQSKRHGTKSLAPKWFRERQAGLAF